MPKTRIHGTRARRSTTAGTGRIAVGRRLLVAVCTGACAQALVFVPARTTHAHHAPAETIVALSLMMEENGPSADLLCRRAVEYRILDELDAAKRDLAAAIALAPDHLSAHVEHSRVLSAMGRHDEALAAARRAGTAAKSARAAAFCLALEAGALADAGRHESACERFAAAVAAVPDGEIDWFLQWADALARIERWDERVEILDDGWQRTRSVALRRAWIDALLDAGRSAEALPCIEAELASSRLRSRWWIRRARALILEGKSAEAESDLEAAIAEISPRLHPTRPDPNLLAECSFALLLLERNDEAREQLKRLESRVGGQSLSDLVRMRYARTVEPTAEEVSLGE